jgi:hypothetical protein
MRLEAGKETGGGGAPVISHRTWRARTDLGGDGALRWTGGGKKRTDRGRRRLVGTSPCRNRKQRPDPRQGNYAKGWEITGWASPSWVKACRRILVLAQTNVVLLKQHTESRQHVTNQVRKPHVAGPDHPTGPDGSVCSGVGLFCCIAGVEEEILWRRESSTSSLLSSRGQYSTRPADSDTDDLCCTRP